MVAVRRQGNTSKVEAQIEAMGGQVGGTNPVSTLAAKTGLSRDEIARVIDSLQRQEKITIDINPHNRMISRITMLRRGRDGYDPTERSEGAKREAMFAKGVPATLPNSLCTPVVVTQGTPRKKAVAVNKPVDESLSSRYMFVEGSPYEQNLTTALNLLREFADEQGVAERTSVRAVLSLMGNMTESRATRLMDHLSGMGIYTSKFVAFQKRTYTLDMSVTEVTAKMVKEWRRREKERLKSRSEASSAETVETHAEEQVSPGVTDPIVPVSQEDVSSVSQASPDDEIGELIAVAREQAERIRNLEVRLQRMTEQRDRQAEEIAGLRTQLDIVNKAPKRDPRIAEVLNEIGKMASNNS